MKTGKTLVELAQELDRQKESKKDYLVNTQIIGMNEDGKMQIKDMIFGTTETFDGQVASKLEIPKKYYDKMKTESPSLLSKNVNHWLHKEPETKMIRTLDGNARAFLSERYRTLDNYDLLQSALPVFAENGCQVASTEVTPDRLYVKALMPKLEAEVSKGDIVQAGVSIMNSETGLSSLRIEPLIYRLVCTNGMIAGTSLKKYHVGKSSATDDIYELLSDKTKMVTDAAFWMQVKDLIKRAFQNDIFQELVQKLRDGKELKIIKPVADVIEVVQKKYTLTDNQGQNIMQELLKGNDFSKYGLMNAVTRSAQDQEGYDEATKLERLGGQIIDLTQNEWHAIAA